MTCLFNGIPTGETTSHYVLTVHYSLCKHVLASSCGVGGGLLCPCCVCHASCIGWNLSGRLTDRLSHLDTDKLTRSHSSSTTRRHTTQPRGVGFCFFHEWVFSIPDSSSAVIADRHAHDQEATSPHIKREDTWSGPAKVKTKP